jgi:hypothetical protein
LSDAEYTVMAIAERSEAGHRRTTCRTLSFLIVLLS